MFVLTVAICVQNTCPQGWVAKTAFAACKSNAVKEAAHCPMHTQNQSTQSKHDEQKHGLSTVKQTFVIYIGGPDNSYQIISRTKDAPFVDSLTLTEIFSEPFFRPPIPSLFA